MDQPVTLSPERLLRQLQWRVVRRLDGRLQGDYRSLFRGTGIDFLDLREYEPGDDLRHIDWNVTARMDTPYVRKYVEDRDVTAWLLLDRTPSMAFGPVQRQKTLVTAEIATTLSHVLARGGNRVGAVLFDGAVEQTIPPGHGRMQVLRIASALVRDPAPRAEDQADARAPARGLRRGRGPRPALQQGTDLAVLLRAGLGVARRRSLMVVVSDFISVPGWEQPLALLARRHDVVAVRVNDPREAELPAVGMVYVEDAETGEQIFVDTSDPAFRARLAAASAEREEELAAAARRAGTELYAVGTDEDLVRALARISEIRRRTRR